MSICINKIRLFLQIAAIYIIFPQILSAQSGALSFSSHKHNFGDIAEDGGRVECGFTYTNTSEKPIVILSTYTSCGCTTSEYSRKPIKSGENGEIKVVFDPMNRPGYFSKKITVTTSANDQPQILYIEGSVIPRVKSIEEQYPFNIGEGVRLSTNFHAFSYIGRNESVDEQIAWINTSSKDVRIKFIPKATSGLLTIQAPKILKAGTKGIFPIIYKVSADSDRYGTLNDIYEIELNGTISRTLFSTNAVAVDKFDRANDDISSPSATFTKKIVKFAEIKHSKIATDNSLELINDGGSDLIIRAVEFNTKGLQCSLKAGDVVRANERVVITLRLNASVCDYGALTDRLRIITNDPEQPMQSVRVTAIVVE